MLEKTIMVLNPQDQNIDWDNILIGNNSNASIIEAIARSEAEANRVYIEQKIVQSSMFTAITFQLQGWQERFVITVSEKNKFPLSIDGEFTKLGESEVWVLSEDPQKWQFVSNKNVLCSTSEKPSEFSASRLEREMSRWGMDTQNCPDEIDQKDFEEFLASNSSVYLIILLWLRFHQLADGVQKDRLREILWTTPELMAHKPDYDLTVANKRFAKDIYPLSFLAQRSAGEHHLWLCLEYQRWLQLSNIAPASKRSLLSANSQFIKSHRKALDGQRDSISLLNIDDLVQQKNDWRLSIDTLLLHDCINKIWENPRGEKQLKKICKGYLSALEQYNKAGRKSDRIISYLDKNGMYTDTRPNQGGRKRRQQKNVAQKTLRQQIN